MLYQDFEVLTVLPLLIQCSVVLIICIIISTAIAFFAISRKIIKNRSVFTKTMVFILILNTLSISSLLLLLQIEEQITPFSYGLKTDTVLLYVAAVISASITSLIITRKGNRDESKPTKAVLFLSIFVLIAVLCYFICLTIFLIIVYRG